MKNDIIAFENFLKISFALTPQEKETLRKLFPYFSPQRKKKVLEAFQKEIKDREKILIQADRKLINKIKWLQQKKQEKDDQTTADSFLQSL